MDIVYDQTGVLFFGNIIKRRLSTSFNHKIILTEDDLGNNTLSADIDVDDSGRHSKITVFSQVQGETNSSATATDSSVVDVKSMAVIINDDDTMIDKLFAGMFGDEKKSTCSVIKITPSLIPTEENNKV